MMNNYWRLCYAFFLAVNLVILCIPSPLMAQIQDKTATHSLTKSMDSLFEEPQFLTTQQAFRVSYQQIDNDFVFKIDIAPQYYLYKEKLSIFIGPKKLPVILPKGDNHFDEYFGEQEVYRDQVVFHAILNASQHSNDLTLHYQGCADLGLCYPPQATLVSTLTQALITQKTSLEPLSKQVSLSNNSEQFTLESALHEQSFLWSLITFFVIGLGLSFTPCVFPMYPILTSIIAGQTKQLSLAKSFTLSMAYVQGMALTYTLTGVIVAYAGMQFQAAFQHPAVLIGLSMVFVLLAMSMFGVINLALPQRWQERLNQMSQNQRGGSTIGVFVMGAISGAVASPCTTAPLTAALLYIIANSGDVLLGASALYALSMAWAWCCYYWGHRGENYYPKAACG